MKNPLDRLISRLDMTKERTSEPEDLSIETSRLKSREKKMNRKSISKNYKSLA
jgi:hypothetical protein